MSNVYLGIKIEKLNDEGYFSLVRVKFLTPRGLAEKTERYESRLDELK